MINVEVYSSAFESKLDDMIEKIDHFKRVDIGQEMSAWQTEDLHRHRPFTMRSRRRGMATTVIRPHSKYEVERSEKYQRGMARRVLRGTRRSMRAFMIWRAKTSMRPILRAEMYQRFLDRMNRLFNEKLVWK